VRKCGLGVCRIFRVDAAAWRTEEVASTRENFPPNVRVAAKPLAEGVRWSSTSTAFGDLSAVSPRS
jgi:hypothetical protein